MTKNYGISENSIPFEAPITLGENSRDLAFLDPKRYRLAGSVRVSNYLSSNLLDSDIGNPGGPGGGDDKANAKPELEDIVVIENSVYKDEKGISRAKIVFRVRNSSGKTLLGVDARKAILATEGGQS